MVGRQYDLLAKPLGVVHATFEKVAVAAVGDGAGDLVAPLRGKDWGAVEVFRIFLFEQGGLHQNGSTWRTNKFTDFSSFPVPHPCDSHLWERHLLHGVPVPG